MTAPLLIATLTDYETAYPDAATDSQSRATAVAALQAATADIQDFCSQLLVPVDADIITVSGTGSRYLLLPECPVTAVNAITIDQDLPTELAVTTFRISARNGILYRLPDPTVAGYCTCGCSDPFDCCCIPPSSWGWPRGFSNITVNYDHGYAAMPANLVQVAASLAHESVNAGPLRLHGEKIEGYSYTREVGATTVDDFSGLLNRHKLKQTSVP